MKQKFLKILGTYWVNFFSTGITILITSTPWWNDIGVDQKDSVRFVSLFMKWWDIIPGFWAFHFNCNNSFFIRHHSTIFNEEY